MNMHNKTMKTLHIQDNQIINISQGEPQSDPPEGQEYIVVPESEYVGVGWIRDGENWVDPNPPVIPDPPPPSPNFDGFVDSLAYGIGVQFPLIQAWYNSLEPVTRDPLQIAIGAQNLAAINDRLLKTMAKYPPDEATTEQIVEALIYFKIPVNLGG
jgi:hypothetical protein